jgi:hypothetical protein
MSLLSLGVGNKEGAAGNDADVQAFLNATGITDSTITSALNTLVTSLKTNSIWSGMSAIYPMVGGTSTTCSYNLRNTANFQITWHNTGSLTFASNGVLGGGINGYGDTGIIPSSNLSLNANSFGYCNGNTNTGNEELGCRQTGSNLDMDMSIDYGGICYVGMWSIGGGQQNSFSQSTAKGFVVACRSSSTTLKSYLNGTLKATNSNANAGSLPTISIFLLGMNLNGSVNGTSNTLCTFACFGGTLSDTDASNLSSAVSTFNTALGR